MQEWMELAAKGITLPPVERELVSNGLDSIAISSKKKKKTLQQFTNNNLYSMYSFSLEYMYVALDFPLCDNECFSGT